jgi:hypothetical protein
MTTSITNFSGKYSFLSNFYKLSPNGYVSLDGILYPTVEHAYQAAKTNDVNIRNKIALAETPSKAKYYGRSIKQLRDDWSIVKFKIMYDLVYQKFHNDSTLMKLLLQTGSSLLIEGNTWNDRIWGVTLDQQGQWVGENHLGKILMFIRDQQSI